MPDFKSFVYQIIQKFDFAIKAKCVVHFRPKKDWKGNDYGFDWMRLGDTGDFGDTQPYKNIVSKQYLNASTTNLVMDINAYNGNFRPNTALYNSLKTEYRPLTIPWKTVSSGGATQMGEYFCSWLSLFPATVKSKPLPPLKPSEQPVDKPSGYANTEADLRLYLDIEESPDYLEFEENEHFEITPKKITDDLGVGKRFWKGGNTTVKIRCKTDFNVDQTIDVFAVKKDVILKVDDKKLAGRLYVWANYPARRKKRKVVFVQVLTPNNSKGKVLTSEKNRISTYLRQSLLELDNNSVIVKLDISTATDFNGFINPTTKGIIISNGTIKLDDYLKMKLQNQEGNTYDSFFKAFYFADNGDSNLSGYSALNADYVVVFNKANNQTAAHEFLHSLNLAHSFTNSETSPSAKYTYTYKMTENLMDYSHHDPAHLNDRSALWKWQWELANSSAN
jgi:hypothetical protein